MTSKTFYGRSSTSNDHVVMHEDVSCSHVSGTGAEVNTFESSVYSDTDDQETSQVAMRLTVYTTL